MYMHHHGIASSLVVDISSVFDKAMTCFTIINFIIPTATHAVCGGVRAIFERLCLISDFLLIASVMLHYSSKRTLGSVRLKLVLKTG